ncbi:hydroxyisourate hydrolase [Herbaspirillum sp. HC18]|nr:hydroxyisourate hydrolase [Herbaspirillum sp. HC18]
MSANELPRRKFLATGLALGASVLATSEAIAQTAPAAPVPAATGGPGRLTMHAIDVWTGLPASGIRVDLSILDGDKYRLVQSFDANKGGRSDKPLFEGENFVRGSYELLLHVEEHYAKLGAKMPQPAFLTNVPIRFSIADPSQRYHIAILLTPWSYSYYRGS